MGHRGRAGHAALQTPAAGQWPPWAPGSRPAHSSSTARGWDPAARPQPTHSPWPGPQSTHCPTPLPAPCSPPPHGLCPNPACPLRSPRFPGAQDSSAAGTGSPSCLCSHSWGAQASLGSRERAAARPHAWTVRSGLCSTLPLCSQLAVDRRAGPEVPGQPEQPHTCGDPAGLPRSRPQ